MKRLLEKFNEFLPLLITVALTGVAALAFHLAPGWFTPMEGNNPDTPWFNASEFQDIILRTLKLFAFTGTAILVMMMLFPGAWASLEAMMRDKDYQPRWIRDTFICCCFFVLLLALALI